MVWASLALKMLNTVIEASMMITWEFFSADEGHRVLLKAPGKKQSGEFQPLLFNKSEDPLIFKTIQNLLENSS